MRSNVLPFPAIRMLRVAHRWCPEKGAAVSYCGKPARVVLAGAASTEIELIHDRGHLYRTWVGTAILKPWNGAADQLSAFEATMAGERPCDSGDAA